MKIDLSGKWNLKRVDGNQNITAAIPGSVLDALIGNGIVQDPYYRDNAEYVRKYLMYDYVFSRTFTLPKKMLENKNYLFLDGVDTAAKIYLNGVQIAQVNDMHMRYRILLDNSLLRNENEIRIEFCSPYRYIEEYNDKGMFLTFAETEKKSPCMRKANYMFGWDWAPNLADMGIYRSIYIFSTNVGYLQNFRYSCTFLGNDCVKVNVKTHFLKLGGAKLEVELSRKEDKYCQVAEANLDEENNFSFIIENARLWYPNGFGGQPLYDLVFRVDSRNGERQEYAYRIGLREVTVDNTKDEYGLNFSVYVNGEKVFLKGANYIPQDMILSRVTPDRTMQLLNYAKEFNYNCLRVWGGGYYPDDDFYESCDELGILIIQDLMIACEVFNTDDKAFMSLLCDETRDALRRIRHHACIIMISGNNECEDGVRGHGEIHETHYKILSEEFITPVVQEETDHYYLRSSPTSEELFVMTNDTDNLDTHYWEVWHQFKPYNDYCKIYPRLLSEFGCQSMPTYETVCDFADKGDLSLDSPVMIFHQRDSTHKNEKLLFYVNDLYRKPEKFEDLVYLSILSQAEGIKTCVEHLRRNKYRCNGALYWQFNDAWPAITWVGIDYGNRLKAVFYFSRKFFAPHLISAHEEENKLLVNISNDTKDDAAYRVTYRHALFDGTLLDNRCMEVKVEKASDKTVININSPFANGRKDSFVYVKLETSDGKMLSDNYYQRYKDKDVIYQKPQLKLQQIDKNVITLETNTYTKGIFLSAAENSLVFSDNYFCLQNGEVKTITADKPFDILSLKIKTLNTIEE